MSIIRKGSVSSKNTVMASECDSSEESGWTKYFEDFFDDNHEIHDQKCSLSFSGGGVDDGYSTSFVSDAASLAAMKKLTDSTQAQESIFKKRKKIKIALLDDALEDTASSPIKGFKEKGNTLGERGDERNGGFHERDSDHTELKKKGLCLVPLSMIVKYLG